MNNEFVDTHCHIHQQSYGLPPDEVIESSIKAGVSKLICVGTDVDDSIEAVKFSSNRDNCWATVGIHPHESRRELDRIVELDELIKDTPKGGIVAVGEVGLDYYYNHSTKDVQIDALHQQLEIASKHSLPVIFHVRDAFDDFFSIIDLHQDIRGVVHSFSAGRKELEQILSRSLFVGLNGIMTFTTKVDQLDAAKRIPLDSMVMETDSPFLTPVPNRGKVNSPEFLIDTARHLSKLREESLELIAVQTTKNSKKLFNI